MNMHLLRIQLVEHVPVTVRVIFVSTLQTGGLLPEEERHGNLKESAGSVMTAFS
jgi:hypothetical protein